MASYDYLSDTTISAEFEWSWGAPTPAFGYFDISAFRESFTFDESVEAKYVPVKTPQEASCPTTLFNSLDDLWSQLERSIDTPVFALGAALLQNRYPAQPPLDTLLLLGEDPMPPVQDIDQLFDFEAWSSTTSANCPTIYDEQEPGNNMPRPSDLLRRSTRICHPIVRQGYLSWIEASERIV